MMNKKNLPSRALSGLTLKQEKFCHEFCIDLNATKAAIRAGYSGRSAREQASRMLTNVDIQSRISEIKKASFNRVETETELDLSADRILQEIAAMAYVSIGDFLEFDSSGTARLNIVENLHYLRGVTNYSEREFVCQQPGNSCPHCRVIQRKLSFGKARALDLLLRHRTAADGKYSPELVNQFIARLEAKLSFVSEQEKGTKP